MNITLQSDIDHIISWTAEYEDLEETLRIAAISLRCTENHHLIAVEGKPATDEQKSLWMAYAGDLKIWTAVERAINPEFDACFLPEEPKDPA